MYCVTLWYIIGPPEWVMNDFSILRYISCKCDGNKIVLDNVVIFGTVDLLANLRLYLILPPIARKQFSGLFEERTKI